MSEARILPAWEPYRPSNGTEGEMFMELWCFKCAKERRCPILSATFCYDIRDPEYPKEWVRQANDDEWPGTARCTAFVPTEELSKRAKRAWVTRRRNANPDLFTEGTRP